MVNAFQVVKDFEQALCEYTGAPHAVAVNSCTMAILLAVSWYLRGIDDPAARVVDCPKRTYVGVPMSIVHAGGMPRFVDKEWVGEYRLDPLPVWDSARLLTSGMYRTRAMQCLSFHWSKTLGIQQGGAILTHSAVAANWLRRARFDGRAEGVPPINDKDMIIGWHCYMSPEIAAEGLVRMQFLPKHNDPLPNSNYPDCSRLLCFGGDGAQT